MMMQETPSVEYSEREAHGAPMPTEAQSYQVRELLKDGTEVTVRAIRIGSLLLETPSRTRLADWPT